MNGSSLIVHLASPTDGKLSELLLKSGAGWEPALVVHEGVLTGVLRRLQDLSVAVVVPHHGALGVVLKQNRSFFKQN